MTKQNSTLITLVLDRSGSMKSCLDGTIEGFNSFIDSHKKSQSEMNDDVKVSLIQFDNKYELNYNMLPIQNVPYLNKETFVPRGMTALHDAIGKTINDVGEKLSSMRESERPSKVLVVIMTDGGENASKEFNGDMIKKMIEHQEKTYSWEFVYVGANQDAIAVGSSIGVKTANNMNYDASNVGATRGYSKLSDMSVRYKTTGFVDLN